MRVTHLFAISLPALREAGHFDGSWAADAHQNTLEPIASTYVSRNS